MVTSPSVSNQLVNYPFCIVIIADIVECLSIPLWEQCIVVRLICPKQPHIKCRVHSASFELVGEIKCVC